MTVKRRPGALALVAQRTAWMTLLAVTACGNYRADDSECSLDGPPIALPGALRETSGVATGIRNPSLVWTHNDRGRGPVLYAVDRDGHVHARIELNQSNDDWEDVARGRCDLGACLYVAGTGDNEERRDIISFYRLAEPEGEGDRRVEAERYRMVLPDGPRDIEAMYVLPTDQIFFVTKGRNHPVTIYRYPSPLRSEGIVTLVEVQRLTAGPVALPRYGYGCLSYARRRHRCHPHVREPRVFRRHRRRGAPRARRGARRSSDAPGVPGRGRRVRCQRSDRPELGVRRRVSARPSPSLVVT